LLFYFDEHDNEKVSYEEELLVGVCRGRYEMFGPVPRWQW